MVRLHLAVFLITCGLVACGDDDDDIPCQHDADCPDGLECEIEHGKAFCKPHGGDDDDATGDTATGDTACQTDADCPDGQECELEHGASSCKPHGGDDTGSGGSNSGSG